MRRRDDGPEVARLLELAADALDDGDADAALARAEEALARAPRSGAALQARAEALVLANRIDEALETYDRAVAQGKDDADVLVGAADLLVNRLADDDRDRDDLERGGELARAAAKVARRAGEEGLEGEAAFVEGAALTQLGRADEALARLEVAARLLPDAPEVHLERGIALYELLRWDGAREALLRAEGLAPDDAWTQHQLGLVATTSRRRSRSRERRSTGRSRRRSRGSPSACGARSRTSRSRSRTSPPRRTSAPPSRPSRPGASGCSAGPATGAAARSIR